MKDIKDLKKYSMECAHESRAITDERLKLKASGDDRQSLEYQKSMWAIAEKRQGCRYKGRLAHLAHCFRRGVPYLAIEAKTDDPPSVLGIATVAGVEEAVVLDWMNLDQKEEAA